MKKVILILLVGVIIFLTSCASNHTCPAYSMNDENVQNVKS